MMKRIGRVVRIKPQMLERYRQLHQDVWPDVLAALKLAGISNYTIYQHADLLFSYMEYTGHDFDADRATLLADPAMQKWNSLTGPCIEPLPSAGGTAWLPMDELFHLD